MPITPNIIQIMKHDVNASVLTTNTEIAFAFLLVGAAAPRIAVVVVMALPSSSSCCNFRGGDGAAAFPSGAARNRRWDYAGIVRKNYCQAALLGE
jgi:hypothetical protein